MKSSQGWTIQKVSLGECLFQTKFEAGQIRPSIDRKDCLGFIVVERDCGGKVYS